VVNPIERTKDYLITHTLRENGVLLWQLAPELLALWEASDPNFYSSEPEWDEGLGTARDALNARAAEIFGGE